MWPRCSRLTPDLIELTEDYARRTPAPTASKSARCSKKLGKIINNHVGLIELAEDLDIETVTEIFIRVNSAGAELSQADFAMSKIAANETYGGNMLRKAIDYFCHLAVAPEFLGRIEKGDKAFAASEFLPADALAQGCQRRHLRPDLHRHAARGVHLGVRARQARRTSSRCSRAATSRPKQYEDAIAEASFGRLKQGILRFINKTHFDRITMILRSAGFVTSDLIGGQNAVNFAYILYLRGRAEKCPPPTSNGWCGAGTPCRSCAGATRGSPETAFDFDIRQVEARGLAAYAESVIENELPESFWTGMLPQLMDTSSAQQPLLPRLSGGAGEARRQGLPLARHHRARPADEPQRRAPRLPAQSPEEAGPFRAAATTRSPTSCWPRARSTSPSATRRPRSISRNWPSSARAARRNTAASPTAG